MDAFCGSDFWNINYTWASNEPKFTPCFQETVLVWIPCAILWLSSIPAIYISNRSKFHLIPWNWLNCSKLVTCGILIILSFLDFQYALFWHPAEKIMHGVDYSSSLVKNLTFILAGYIIFIHRKHGIRTSAVMFAFWFLLCLCGLPHFLSAVNAVSHKENLPPDYLYISNVIYYFLIVFICILSAFTDACPLYSQYPSVEKQCPDMSVSFLCSWITLWFDSMAWKFYKRTVDINELWDPEYESSVKYLVPKFEKFWNMYSRKKKKRLLFSNIFELNGFMGQKQREYEQLESKQQTSVLPILWRCFGFTYFRSSVFKLCSDMLVFVNPLLLSLLIRFGENNEPTWHGYVYATLILIVSLFQTLFIDWYVFRVFDLGIRIRSTLTAIIYKKALRISSIARRSFNLGEITNLMSVDAQRFVEVNLYLNMAISGIYQISIAMYLLWSFLGPSMLAGLAVMLILIPINAAVATKAKTFQIQQMRYKDERIKISTEVLSGIKTLKMYAWETSFEDKILKIREKEIEQLKRIAYLNTAVSFIWGCAPFLVSVASFAVFTLSNVNNVLSAETAFVSLALFNVIRLPISLFPRIFPNLVQTYVAIKRIDKYLNAEELDEFNVNHNKLEKHAIVFKDSSFSWEKVGSPTLRNINITVPDGSLVAVVGSVGAGKSSLVSALLGEMYKVNGYINIRGSVAYVPQQAWLLNDTLRNNIVFSSHYKSGKYDRVIDACSLTTDLKILPGGDHTEIGEKGVNLSGGQKQRISLARAIYHDADVYLLDDPLSAVDAHVGKHIFENVIGPNGLLRKKTRFFVTHAISFLPEVDFIIVMTNGQISDQGTYNELISKGGAFSEFLTNHTNEMNIDVTEENLPEKKIMRSISEDSDVGFYVSPFGSQISTESATHSIVVGEKLIEDEYIESGNVKSDIYLHYFKRGNIKLWISAVIFEVVFQGFTVLTNFSLSNWSTDPAAVSDGVQDIGKRNFYLSIYCGFGIGQFLFVFLTTFCIYKASVNASSYMHFAVLNKILRWPSYMFDVTPIGRILSRLSFDMDVVDNTIPFTLLEIFNIMGAVTSILFVIIYNSPLLAFAVIPIMLTYIVIERVYVSIERQLKRLESASRSPIYSHFGETISGAAVIRAYGVAKNFISKSEYRININQIYTFASIVATRWVGNRMNILGNAIIFFTALLSVVGRNTLNSGIIGLSLTYVLQIGGILFWVVKMATDLETNIVSVERLKQCENTAPEEEMDKKLLSSKVSVSWPENGEVEFKNFKVRYRKDLDFVLRGINFKAKSGEKVGIVGRTGAGKSSLTLSLFRIVEAAAGSIEIDGIDISTIDMYTLRSRITIIPQDPVIFSGSLRFNLDPFSRYSDQKIFHALELAHLKDYVLSLPNKLHHTVSESGENLSIGQRQLLCLARALLRKTKILILDEATAAVDLETDDLIQRTIRTEFKNCTIFTIAHRLNTILDSDRVIVLDKGLIVEFNDPNVLLSSKDTLFYKMAKDAGIVS